MGILQRVAVCYYSVALMEIFLPRLSIAETVGTRAASMRERLGTMASLFRRYAWFWCAGLVLFLLHTAIMYGVDVPDIPEFNVTCGRGVLTPPCNAATYIDRHILTVPHMYFPSNGGGDASSKDVTYQRLPECSTCSPGKCVPPPDAPLWCMEGPFDPEGLVSSLNAILATVLGVHYGHVLMRITDPVERLWHWGPFSVLQVSRWTHRDHPEHHTGGGWRLPGAWRCTVHHTGACIAGTFPRWRWGCCSTLARLCR